jgi:hypothetical protein
VTRPRRKGRALPAFWRALGSSFDRSTDAIWLDAYRNNREAMPFDVLRALVRDRSPESEPRRAAMAVALAQARYNSMRMGLEAEERRSSTRFCRPFGNASAGG